MRGLSLHRVGWRRAFCPRPQLPQRRYASTTTPAAERGRDVDLSALTAKWQPRWDELSSKWPQLRKSDRGKAYILPMFPYPSGTLHLGHLRVYTISDVLARFKQMQGYDVLHPIGWDAFGLPAENAALERGVHPEKWTRQNIESMKKQMMQMGGHWSWDREILTCDPDFYKHTQRIFLMLHDQGLAYQAESLVNYDPVDKTVLANEQVDANGCSWRSGAKVEKKLLKQWFLKIKEFQEPLLKDLDTLAENGRWPERVLAMQKNWIGKSKGTKLRFDILSTDGELHFDSVEVFTTRADTLFGVQYVALSLNHPIVKGLAKTDGSLRAFLERAKDLPPDSKEGYLLPNITAINPIADVARSNTIDVSVPVYAAPYVLDDYGSGAVMGVPGHDTRDHAFWRANAGVRPIKTVVTIESGEPTSLLESGDLDRPMIEKGFVATDIEGFSNLSSFQAIDLIVERLQQAGKTAEKTDNWRLKDWLISRQRYWGTPIPIIHCNSCGSVPVPEKDLPVKLPDLPDSFFQGRTGNPLADTTWKNTHCPKCGSAAERETDTMDTFMCSSWYFFRFLDSENKGLPIDPKLADKGMPVDVYIGGVEHAILHLLYARFISKFLATTPLWPQGKLLKGEPFKKLITQGMVHGETFSDPETGRFLRPEEVDLSNPTTPVIKVSGLTPKVSFEKMSKSKHNGVDPGATIAKYGADATRAHMLFQAPVGDVLEWDEKKISGVQRWLSRVIKLSSASWYPKKELEPFEPPKDIDVDFVSFLRGLRHANVLEAPQLPSNASPLSKEGDGLISALKPEEMALWSKTQETIASVTSSYSETYSLNTVVSDLMTLTNTIWDTPPSSVALALKWLATVHLLRMVAPIAPGVAEEGWQLLHETTNVRIHKDESHPLHKNGAPSVFAFGFPVADLAILPKLNPTTTCVFQVDGKKKFEVGIPKVPANLPKEDTPGIIQYVLDELLKTDQGKEWLEKETGKVWKASETNESHPSYKAVPNNWKVIAVKNGAILNLVGPKKAKGNRSGAGPGATGDESS